jgi:hypothetical protein
MPSPTRTSDSPDRPPSSSTTSAAPEDTTAASDGARDGLPGRRTSPDDADGGPGLDESRRSPWRIPARIAVIGVVVVIAVMWAFALFGHIDVPGQLADTTFPNAAEPVCKAAMAQIDALPPAPSTPDPNQRADVIDHANAILDQMLVDLRAKVPATQPEHDRINQWLDDWTTYVGDRKAYAAQLRVDRNARFYVTQSDRDNSQITNAIDNFATVNPMPDCATPQDV